MSDYMIYNFSSALDNGLEVWAIFDIVDTSWHNCLLLTLFTANIDGFLFNFLLLLFCTYQIGIILICSTGHVFSVVWYIIWYSTRMCLGLLLFIFLKMTVLMSVLSLTYLLAALFFTLFLLLVTHRLSFKDSTFGR